MPEFAVTPEDAGARLDQYLAAKLPQLSRSRLQALIRQGCVLLQGRVSKPGERLRAGGRIAVEIPEAAAPEHVAPEAIPLAILYEDDDLLVLDKPAGMVVHPAAGNPDGTLVNALLHHCGALSSVGGERRPGIVHRLDKETSGCLVAAKNDLAHQGLARQFAGREVLKVYLALASGRFAKKSGRVETEIGRHPVHRKKMAVVEKGRGRVARTEYRVLREMEGGASLVECTLHTGRTHQIRVHLRHLGHPLLGDALYGKRGAYPRQMLHAWKLGFAHPRSGERLQFEAPVPTDFAGAGGMP